MTVLRTDRPNRRFPTAATAAVAIFVIALAWRFLTFTGFSNDHYAHFALAQQMLLGERPIRDFSDPGWPLTYMLSAGAWWLAGDAMWVEWTVIAVALALGAVFTVLAAYRLAGVLWIAVLVTLLELAIYPRTYAYPKILVYAVGAWLMVWVAGRPSPGRLVGMSATIAGAFLLRHDHGLFLGVAAAVCITISSRAEGWRVAFARAGMLTGATALWLLPWMLFVAANGGLTDYFDRALEYARAEANASNLRTWPQLRLMPGKPLLGLERFDRPLAQVEWRPDLTEAERSELERRYGLDYVRESDNARWYYVYDPSDDNLSALANDQHVAGTSGLGRVNLPAWREFLARVSPFRVAPALHTAANADAWLYWLYWILPVVSGALAIRGALCGTERWRGELGVIGGLCVMAALVNTGFLRDILRTRLADAIVPAALLGAWTLSLSWRGRWRHRVLQTATQLVTIVILIASVGAIRQVGEWPERIERTAIAGGVEGVLARVGEVMDLLRHPHRQDIAPPSRVSAALMPFFNYLDRCTSQSEQLIVTGEFPDVPVLAGRAFAGDGVVFGAWYSSTRHQDRTVAQLRARPPLFVVYVDAQAFRSRFRLIEEFVRDRYRPMTEIPAEGFGTVPILIDRSRVPTTTDADTGWPCFRSTD